MRLATKTIRLQCVSCGAQVVIDNTQGKIAEVDALLERLARVEDTGYFEPLQFSAPHMRSGRVTSDHAAGKPAGTTPMPAIKSAATQPKATGSDTVLPPLEAAADGSIQL